MIFCLVEFVRSQKLNDIPEDEIYLIDGIPFFIISWVFGWPPVAGQRQNLQVGVVCITVEKLQRIFQSVIFFWGIIIRLLSLGSCSDLSVFFFVSHQVYL